MSMAAGEFVSVHSQADTEKADLERERIELHTEPAAEHRELAAIYVRRGLDAALAEEVAQQLMAHDALEAHARDELGISAALTARPVQAALASAGSFAAGAALPLLVVAMAPGNALLPWLGGTTLVFLAALGAVAARARGRGHVRRCVACDVLGCAGARSHLGGGRIFWRRGLTPQSGCQSSSTRSPCASARSTSCSASVVQFCPFAPQMTSTTGPSIFSIRHGPLGMA